MKYTQSDRKVPGDLTRICETCGREGLLEYMYAIGASWQVTGHSGVTAFNCQTEATAQHWGCTPQHAIMALKRCLDHSEHMGPKVMQRKHKEAEDAGNPRVPTHHQSLLDMFGDDFQFKFVDVLIKQLGS